MSNLSLAFQFSRMWDFPIEDNSIFDTETDYNNFIGHNNDGDQVAQPNPETYDGKIVYIRDIDKLVKLIKPNIDTITDEEVKIKENELIILENSDFINSGHYQLDITRAKDNYYFEIENSYGNSSITFDEAINPLARYNREISFTFKNNTTSDITVNIPDSWKWVVENPDLVIAQSEMLFMNVVSMGDKLITVFSKKLI